MSSITRPSAAQWSHRQVRIPFLQDLTYQPDELFAVLPFIGVESFALDLNQVDVSDPQAYVTGGSMGTRVMDPTANPGTAFTGADASAKDAYDVITPGDPPFRRFFLKDILGDVDLNNMLRRLYSNANVLREQQVGMKLQVMRYQYSQMLINGVGTGQNDRDFAGLNTLVPAAQTRPGTGVLHDDLDAIEYLVRARTGKADYFLLDFLTYGLYIRGLRAVGINPQVIPSPWIGGKFCAMGDTRLFSDHRRFQAESPPPLGPSADRLRAPWSRTASLPSPPRRAFRCRGSQASEASAGTPPRTRSQMSPSALGTSR
jgi:hypothetical protein